MTFEMHDDLSCFIFTFTFIFETGPDIASMGLANSLDDCPDIGRQSKSLEDGNGEIDLSGIDDDEIDSYIMSEREAQYKDSLWMKINAAYLKEQKGIYLSWFMVKSSLNKALYQIYDLMLSWRAYIMKFSRAISWVRWFSFLETNVSKTISVLYPRKLHYTHSPGKHQIVYHQHRPIADVSHSIPNRLHFLGY
jgi:hypothetical protein